MPSAKVGGYQLEYDLTGFGVPVNSHKLRSNIMVSGSPAGGTPATSIDVFLRGGGTAKLDVVANQVWSYFRLMYDDSITAVGYTLWYWATDTARDFVTAGTLTTPAGAAAGSPAQNWQQSLTFRSANGGIAKLVFMESNFGGNQRSALLAVPAGTAPQRVAAFAGSSASPFMALDNSFFVAPLRDSRGENEAIRNRRVGVS
jgi:hypothetical protein